tara:strand:- start:23 stop:691 length:669 start_codon:yes stop_codon:yes gene_type:complete
MLSLKQGLSLDSIRVQGAWSPDDETSLEAWYQNAVGITLNGSDVSQWSDSSTNSHDMIQGTAAAQPAYSAGVLTFDGTDDNLASSQINLTGACTIAIRGDFTGVTNRTILGDDDASNAFLKLQSTTVLRIRVAAGLINFTLSSGTFGDDYLVITRDGSNNVNAYRNGVSISAEQSRSGSIRIDNLGTNTGGTFFNGTMKEVQIYSSTSADLTANINSRLASL